MGRGFFFGGRVCCWRRERIFFGFGGGEVFFLVRWFCFRCLFFVVVKERFFFREVSFVWRELRRFFLFVLGLMGFRFCSLVVVGLGGVGGGFCWFFLLGDGGGCWVGLLSWFGFVGWRGGCLRGDEFLIFFVRVLFCFGFLDGVLCIFDGGVLIMGLGCLGVGGSFGLGIIILGSMLRGGDCWRFWWVKGLIVLVVFLGVGGGSGCGMGFGSVFFVFGCFVGEWRFLFFLFMLVLVFWFFFFVDVVFCFVDCRLSCFLSVCVKFLVLLGVLVDRGVFGDICDLGCIWIVVWGEVFFFLGVEVFMVV